MSGRVALGEISSDIDRIGFFGKLPTHGDFVSSGLGPKFQAFLDTWLQAGMQAAQLAMDGVWEQYFRSMSPWRFVIERGIWGDITVAGVIAPSLDRVGRSFPLVIAAQIHDYADDPQRLYFDHAWFTAAEGIAETAGKRDFEIGRFTESVRRLRSPRPIEPDDGDDLRRSLGRSVLWWRIDVEDRQPKGFRTPGAPKPEDFSRLVSEGATRAVNEPSPISRTPAVTQTPSAGGKATIALNYGGATHAGTRLSQNADALLMRNDPDIAALSDGLGDSGAAVEAARLTLQILGNIPAQEDIAALVQETKGKLGHAHGLLQSSAQNAAAAPRMASLVTLLRHGDNLAVVWVGDARCYILRHGTMRCLTRDHVEIGLRRSLARAVGMSGSLRPDLISDVIQPHDRLLLCSGPLVRSVPERNIAEILSSTDIDRASEVLVQEALIAGCRENVSAIVVHAVPDGG